MGIQTKRKELTTPRLKAQTHSSFSTFMQLALTHLHTNLASISTLIPQPCLHASLSKNSEHFSHTSYEFVSCFHNQKDSAPSNAVTRSLPSLLNLSTGEKPRGEEDEAERRAGGGGKKENRNTESKRVRENNRGKKQAWEKK